MTHWRMKLNELIILADKPENSIWCLQFCSDMSFSLLIVMSRNPDWTLKIFSQMHPVKYPGEKLPKLFQSETAPDTSQTLT